MWRKDKTLQVCSNPSRPRDVPSSPWNLSTPVFYCLSAISNSFLQLNEEGQQEIKFHLHLKDVVHVGSSINQRLQHLLLKRKVNCNQTFHSLFSATIPACCWGNWCQHRAQQGGSVSLSSPVSSSPQPPRGSVVSPYWHRSWCLDDMKYCEDFWKELDRKRWILGEVYRAIFHVNRSLPFVGGRWSNWKNNAWSTSCQKKVQKKLIWKIIVACTLLLPLNRCQLLVERVVTFPHLKVVVFFTKTRSLLDDKQAH